MTKNEKVGLGILGALAVAGVGFYVYEQNKNNQTSSGLPTNPTSIGTASSSSESANSGATDTTSSSGGSATNSDSNPKQATFPVPTDITVVGSLQPTAAQSATQSASGISGPVTPAISGTSPSIGDPGWIEDNKWYPTISQVPNKSSAVAAWTIDSYYDQFAEVVS
ncbi:MAG: hypothetical protein OWR52_04060 [Acidibacillus sp.]|nr:hypothetical protein [Acidibacillus sp.]